MIHAFDVESHLIDKGNPLPKGVCVSFASEDGTKGVLAMEDGLKWVREKLDAGDTLIAHNARFDFGVCAADDPDLLGPIFQAYSEGRVRDTGIRQKILDNARGALKYEWNEETSEFKAQRHSLAHLCKRVLDVWRFDDKEGDVWRMRYYTLDGIPVSEWPKGATDYAIQDSEDALAIYQAQEKDPEAELLDLEWSQTQADWALGLMSAWGSRTDIDDIEVLREEYQDEYDEWADKCVEFGLASWKKSTKKEREGGKGEFKCVLTMDSIFKLVEEHYGKHDLEVPMTEGGKGEVKNPKVATDRDTLLMKKFPAIEPHEGMVAVSNLVKVGKLLSTYIKTLMLGVEYPINPNYNAILETFRTSCSKPNIQNLTRGGGVRKCWKPRPGYVYGFCDYDSLEMRTLAQVYFWMFPGRTCPLLDAVVEGKDPHLEMAAQMLSISYEDAEKLLSAEDEVVMETRQGCFHPDTEILTPSGWKKVEDIKVGDVVAAAAPGDDGARIEWQKATATTRRTLDPKGNTPYDKLYHFKTEGIDIRVTGNHRMLAYKAASNGGGSEECPATEFDKKRGWYNAGVAPGGSWTPDEKMLRLAVATQADGSYRKTQIGFGFTKQRKIDRIRKLLEGVPGRDAVYTNGENPDVTHFFIYGSSDYPSGNKTPTGPAGEIKEMLTDKHFDERWLDLSSESRRVVLDEVKHWDATSRPADRSFTYFSMQKKNTEIIQIIATLEGLKTRLVQDKTNKIWKLTVRQHTTRKCDRSRGDNLKAQEVDYKGDVVCLSVPSTFVVVRDGGVPCITGNSKIANYGMAGGMGPDAFVEYARGFGVEISIERATELRDAFRRVWHMYPYFERCAEMADSKDPELGFNQMVLPGSGFVRGDIGYTQACNSPFQHLAAMGAKKAVFEVAKACYTDADSPLYGCKPWLFAHDEIGMEVPFDGTEEGRARASRAMKELERIMVECMKHYCPDVPIGATAALCFSWLKGAKPVHRKIGNDNVLVPCVKEDKQWIEQREAA